MDRVTSPGNTTSGPAQNTTCDSVEESDHPLLILVYSLLFLVGLILNSFTLWFHCRGAHGQASKSWMIYLTHLTAADFLLCVSLPLRILHYADRSFTMHLLYCSFGAPLLFLNMCASILFMGFIAANRYMKIFSSSGTHFLMTAKTSHIISMTTWVVLLTVTTPYTILILRNHKHRLSGHSTCDHLLNESLKPLHRAMHGSAAIVFLSVLLSLVFFYYRTSRRVLQVQQRRLGSSDSKKLEKSRRNMLVLVSVFCICFVPYHVVRLPYLADGHCSVALYYLKEVTILLSVFNICLDPVIYVYLCKDFRAQLKLKQRIRTKSSGNPSSPGAIE